jgi:hypothetical protein
MHIQIIQVGSKNVLLRPDVQQIPAVSIISVAHLVAHHVIITVSVYGMNAVSVQLAIYPRLSVT